jgi:hypothetical protein
MLMLLRVFLNAAHDSVDKQPLLRRKSSGGMSSEQISSLMSENAISIVNTIDYDQLQSRLLVFIKQTMETKEITFEHKLILQNALNIWVGSVLQKPELFTKALALGGMDELVMGGLLYCSEEKVREDFKTNLS